jgi:hypothetical protein
VTVPVEFKPPFNVEGERLRLAGVGGRSVMVPFANVVVYVPSNTTSVEVATLEVLTGKVAENCPAGMVTVAGTVTEADGLKRMTKAPFGPAGPFRVAVPTELNPPVTGVGLNVRLTIASGHTVKVALSELPFKLTVRVTGTLTGVVEVVTENVTEFVPGSTVTVAGGVAKLLSDVSVRTNPLLGALPLSVTVAVQTVPPPGFVGVTVKEVSDAGFTVNMVVFWLEPSVAVSVAFTAWATPIVETEIVAEVAPAGTTTLAGTVAEASDDVKLTVAPPVPAGPLRFTVPAAELPPIRALGDTENELRTALLTVSVAVAVPPPPDAVIVETIFELTPTVLTLNVPEVAPAGIVTEAGTVTLV